MDKWAPPSRSRGKLRAVFTSVFKSISLSIALQSLTSSTVLLRGSQNLEQPCNPGSIQHSCANLPWISSCPWYFKWSSLCTETRYERIKRCKKRKLMTESTSKDLRGWRGFHYDLPNGGRVKELQAVY